VTPARYTVEVWTGDVWVTIGGVARDGKTTPVVARFRHAAAAGEAARMLLHAGFERTRVVESAAPAQPGPGTTG
jgi:hypothetical protein